MTHSYNETYPFILIKFFGGGAYNYSSSYCRVLALRELLARKQTLLIECGGINRGTRIRNVLILQGITNKINYECSMRALRGIQ